jgi:hypothetical protein
MGGKDEESGDPGNKKIVEGRTAMASSLLCHGFNNFGNPA